jgi:hypothetical protein
MPLTRTQGEAALKYVVLTVLDQPDDGPLMKSITNDQITDIRVFPSLQEIDIGNLQYPKDDGSLSALGPGQKGLLRAFCAFIKYRSIQSLPIGDNWTSISQEEYDEFCCSTAFDGTIYGLTSSAYPGLPTAPSARARDPVTDFKRGIKQDTSDPKATTLRLDTLFVGRLQPLSSNVTMIRTNPVSIPTMGRPKRIIACPLPARYC